MANAIKLKNSNTLSAVPVTGDFTLGETAINTRDGFMWMGTGSASVTAVTKIGAPIAAFGQTMMAAANSAAGTALLDTATIAVKGLLPVLSNSASQFLNGTGTFSVPGGGGDVSKVGVPVNNQLGVWTGDGTIEGENNLLYDSAAITTAQLALTAESGLTSGDLLNITSNLVGKTGSVSTIDQNHISAIADTLTLNQAGTGNLLKATEDGVEVFTLTQSGYIGNYPGTQTVNHALLYNNGTSRYESRAIVEADISDLQSYALTTHVHNAFDRTTAILSGANVFSDIVVLDGITTGIATRVLTAANIGALPIGGGVLTGALTLNADPSIALHAATKQYVDSVASGLTIKDSVRVATTGVLPAVTPAGVGVGHTLTANVAGVVAVDGQDLTAANNFAVNDRVLIKNQASVDDNGIYIITVLSAVAVALVLTRATDFDTAAEVVSGFAFVEEGTVLADTGWVMTTDGAITMDTTSLVFTQFSGAGIHTASSIGTTFHIWKQKTGNNEEFRGVLNAANGGLALTTGTNDITFALDINNLTDVAAITNGAADFIGFYDASATGTRKTLINNLLDGGTF